MCRRTRVNESMQQHRKWIEIMRRMARTLIYSCVLTILMTMGSSILCATRLADKNGSVPLVGGGLKTTIEIIKSEGRNHEYVRSRAWGVDATMMPTPIDNAKLPECSWGSWSPRVESQGALVVFGWPMYSTFCRVSGDPFSSSVKWSGLYRCSVPWIKGCVIIIPWMPLWRGVLATLAGSVVAIAVGGRIAQTLRQWGQDRHRVYCPQCGYDLAGILNETCPECGETV